MLGLAGQAREGGPRLTHCPHASSILGSDGGRRARTTHGAGHCNQKPRGGLSVFPCTSISKVKIFCIHICDSSKLVAVWPPELGLLNRIPSIANYHELSSPQQSRPPYSTACQPSNWATNPAAFISQVPGARMVVRNFPQELFPGAGMPLCHNSKRAVRFRRGGDKQAAMPEVK